MKRKIFIFGNHLPENRILEKAQLVRQQIVKEELGSLQTTTFTSDLPRCYKNADSLRVPLYSDNRYRAKGLLGSKLYSPALLAEAIQNGDENQHRIAIAVVNYSEEGVIELLKELGADQCVLDLVSRLRVNLEENVIHFDQEDNSLQLF